MQGKQLAACVSSMILPNCTQTYQRVESCSYSEYTAYDSDRSSLNKRTGTKFIHEIYRLLHVLRHCEGNGACVSDIAGSIRRRVVLLLDFNDLADLDEEEDGESYEDEEDDHEADDGLVVGHFFDLAVLEEEVDELVLYLYCYVLLLVRLSVRDHFNLIQVRSAVDQMWAVFAVVLVGSVLVEQCNGQIYLNQIQIMDNQDPNTHLLPIPPRFQWENGHGFCGETSIQSISLYYGNYISQNQVRKIAGSEVLVGQNAEETIGKLSYVYQAWDNNKPKPQYKNFLQWIKTNIKKGYPVIITGYEPKGDNGEYDHIYLALGVESDNMDVYSDNDVLIYADLFDDEYSRTPFGKVWDTRSMSGNGKNLAFAIPRDINYGIAVKGIVDTQEQFLPVRISLKQDSEPNVSLGEASKQFKYTVTASKLTPGTKYAVLRYDSYKDIPRDHVYAEHATYVVNFKAQGTSHSFTDIVESSKMVFYRCIEEQDLE